jgi:hypothetical protein
MNMNWEDFIRIEQQDRERVDFKLIYVDMTGDLVAGLMLSQIVYWNLPAKDGKSRLRVQHDGYLWLAKSREEWWDECRVSPRQVDRGLDILAELGIIERKLYKFNGSPTIHVRLIEDALLHVWRGTISSERENGFYPNSKMDIDVSVKSLTETTTETTTYISEPADAGCADAHDTPLSPPVEKKRSTKTSDPRSKTRAIQCARQINNGRYPPIELYDEIMAILGEAPDDARLTECRREWVARGYNPNGWGWLREWYKQGIPKLQARGKPQEPEQVGGMRRWG